MSYIIKAAVLNKINNDLELKDIFHDGKILKNQVLVKLLYTGICGSQLGEIKGIKGHDRFLPHLLGHEATGKIIKISSNDKEFKVNDKVILHWQKNFGKNSKTPFYYDKNQKKINAGWVTTFNNYAIVSKNRITKLPKKISLKDGVLFGCAITTSYGAIFKDAKVNLNKKNKILITGAGMIGQSILIFLNNRNQNVLVLEKNSKKRKLIKNIYPKVEIINQIEKKYKNTFNFIFETTGKKEVIEKSYDSIKLDGKLILIGVPDSKEKVRINTLGINYGKKIVGSYGGGINPKKDINKIINHCKKEKIELKKLYDKVYEFKNINSIIKKLNSGKIIKKPILRF
jgi:S-(hydroxymethyl)glutathione dehydrogenase/alcohol dehydrogenase